MPAQHRGDGAIHQDAGQDRPARHEHAVDGTARERFVLADWHDRGQYLASDANGIHLREVRGQTRDISGSDP